ncbi:hypothetical protein A8924_4440 [Saccharopolyspora erythraea NRRL 2338]|uniref:Uncharacterized protein n=2 Tax=Saccharopolyspora erythraea TaxID=1836 RepID=A4FGZ6_SACEN|nr:hypothetical protein [Saccharopolyspora erythraea]EQD81840.1 hypothetical protein N599_33980 [Saccharopolyspora erythraea D]PFG97026.1 hypothetical protein A8924_4440 [Saccharopolyspora erythraea NRRL 2338]QRK87234.1 hypothetical protein JQX30_20580 [Saccharopolyspora erythraea]CAM03321.1 hypothetical protein SACE_4050 [Saccharopolyspora erythraea NRRL 2338]
MKLAFLQEIYRSPGPFATVYLDTSADAEDAGKAVELRWRAARDELAGRGVDEAVLSSLEERVGQHRQETGRRAQVLVADRTGVVFTGEMPGLPSELASDEHVSYGPLPHLMPYLQAREPRLPHVVAVVDHVGADLTVVPAEGEMSTRTVEGEDHPVHKTHSAPEELQKHFQQSSEETWKHNAVKSADEITKAAEKISAEALVLAGEVQQRKLVRERLGKGVQEIVVETDAGARDRKAAVEPLEAKIDEAVGSAVSARVDEVVGLFEQERGRHSRAVEGWEPTVEALQREQVQVLLWSKSAHDVTDLSTGPRASQVALDERPLRDMGVEEITTAPASAALVRAVAGVDAELVVVEPGSVELTDGIGAVLRYPLAS